MVKLLSVEQTHPPHPQRAVIDTFARPGWLVASALSKLKPNGASRSLGPEKKGRVTRPGARRKNTCLWVRSREEEDASLGPEKEDASLINAADSMKYKLTNGFWFIFSTTFSRHSFFRQTIYPTQRNSDNHFPNTHFPKHTLPTFVSRHPKKYLFFFFPLKWFFFYLFRSSSSCSFATRRKSPSLKTTTYSNG